MCRTAQSRHHRGVPGAARPPLPSVHWKARQVTAPWGPRARADISPQKTRGCPHRDGPRRRPSGKCELLYTSIRMPKTKTVRPPNTLGGRETGRLPRAGGTGRGGRHCGRTCHQLERAGLSSCRAGLSCQSCRKAPVTQPCQKATVPRPAPGVPCPSTPVHTVLSEAPKPQTAASGSGSVGIARGGAPRGPQERAGPSPTCPQKRAVTPPSHTPF